MIVETMVVQTVKTVVRAYAHVLQITLLVMSMRFLNSIHGRFLNLGGSFLVIINFLS